MDKTTITLPKSLVVSLMSLKKTKTKTEAVREAVKEEIRRKKLEEIKEAAGKIEFTESAEELRHGGDRGW